MILLDSLLDPILRMALAGGPTKVRSFSYKSSTKSAFSDKKPYLNKEYYLVSISEKVCGRYLPRMDCLGLGVLGNFNEVRYFEIRFCRWRRSHHKCLIHFCGVLSELVSLRVHTDSFNA